MEKEQHKMTPKEPIEYPDPAIFDYDYETGCAYCKNLTHRGGRKTEEGWTCKAYPNGIPACFRFAWWGESHETPTLGDNGIIYDPETIEYKGHKFKMDFRLEKATLVDDEDD